MIKQDNEKVECYCQVCDEKIIGATAWMKHIETNRHLNMAFIEIMEHKGEIERL